MPTSFVQQLVVNLPVYQPTDIGLLIHKSKYSKEEILLINFVNDVPVYAGDLRKHMIEVPEVIRQCKGIRIFGKRIKSVVFTTDVAIIRNCNADAVIAIYPFTPQPIITQSLMLAADMPVFCGVGGGTTTGSRVVQMAINAECQGAMGVVVNAPTVNETIHAISQKLEIPVIVTVVHENDDIDGRLKAGSTIFNVAAAQKTTLVVEQIRKKYPQAAIIATGGKEEKDILDTIAAGANAISWTPPSSAELFKDMMEKYRIYKA